MNTYYDLLNVSQDADTATIEQAYDRIIQTAYMDLSNNRISRDDYDRLYRVCTEAKNTLCNPFARAAYNQRCGIDDFTSALNNTGATVVGGASHGPSRDDDEYYDDDYEDDEYDDDYDDTPRRRNWLKIALISGAVVAALGLSAWIVPKVYNTLTLKGDSQNVVGVVTPGESESPEGDYSIEDGKDEEELDGQTPGGAGDQDGQTPGSSGDQEGQTNGIDGQSGTVTVQNYGDIKDAALVQERATKLLDEINKAGMTNLTTGLPYTLEEIQTLILYVNGEYVPDTEEEATDLYTEFLNFICAPINIDHTLIQVAYLGGEESFKGTVEGYIQDQHRPDIVSAFIYGETYAAPYLQWLQNKFYDMRYTTDRDEATRIFNEVFQSFADIMKGDGFVLDGVTYTEGNILGLDKVAVSNMYIFWGLNSEVFRTTATKDYFEVTNHLISAEPEMQKDTASFDELGAWINGACDDELIAVDDQGLPLVTSQGEGRTLGELTQINTIYRAKENYLDVHSKTLSK